MGKLLKWAQLAEILATPILNVFFFSLLLKENKLLLPNHILSLENFSACSPFLNQYARINSSFFLSTNQLSEINSDVASKKIMAFSKDRAQIKAYKIGLTYGLVLV